MRAADDDHRYVARTTYRRDGRAVTTPVWFVALEERLYVFTAQDDREGEAGARHGPNALCPVQHDGRRIWGVAERVRGASWKTSDFVTRRWRPCSASTAGSCLSRCSSTGCAALPRPGRAGADTIRKDSEAGRARSRRDGGRRLTTSLISWKAGGHGCGRIPSSVSPGRAARPPAARRRRAGSDDGSCRGRCPSTPDEMWITCRSSRALRESPCEQRAPPRSGSVSIRLRSDDE